MPVLFGPSLTSRFRKIYSIPCLLAALALLLAAAPSSDEPKENWREGPIRYILSIEEDEAYKKLRTTEARAAFIDRFWAALDPTPDTGINERREEFWRRVQTSIELFWENLVPGWKTDRGKVYILMGPPDRRTRHGPSEVWVYEAAPRAGAPLETRLEFRRMSWGDYRMPAGALRYHDPLAELDGVPAGNTFLSATSDKGLPRLMKGRFRMVEFPTPFVDVEYFVESLDVKSRYDYFRAEDGNTHVVLTLAIPPAQLLMPDGTSEPPDLSVLAMLEEPESGSTAAHLTDATQFDTGDPDTSKPWLYRNATTVPPGTYRASIRAFDRRRHWGSTSVQTLEVPNFKRKFALSSIVVGHVPPLPVAPPKGGPTELIAVRAEPEPVFLEGETAYFAFQVYNARHRRGKPRLEAHYRFFIRIGEEFRQAGNPIILPDLTGESLTYALEVKGWPVGKFRIEVLVTDALSKKSATGEALFRVGAGSSER